MECLRCGYKRAFRVMGDCGHVHFACTSCKSEWCSLYKEWEQLGPTPTKRRIPAPVVEPEPEETPVKKRAKGNGSHNIPEVFDALIMEASAHLGDMMGEYAEGEYEEKGGMVGMVEGRFELKKDEVKECMYESLHLLELSIGRKKKVDLDALRIDRKKLVDYWYRRDFK